MLSGPRKPRNVAVFISGGGSTLQALLEFHHQIDISLIVSSNPKAAGLKKALRFGKKVFSLTRPIDFESLHTELLSRKVEVILLAGFMKVLPANFVQKWHGRIINIHPSLLPAYPGLNSAQRSWDDNANMGVTLHHVVAELDSGETLLQTTSLREARQLDFAESDLLLRRSEQFLLREMVLRYF